MMIRHATPSRTIRRAQPAILAAILGLLLIAPPFAMANWPGWRGPERNGVAAKAHNLPANWGPEENIRWKTPLPAWSGSTPVLWGDRIFLSSPSAETATTDTATTTTAKAGGRGPGGQELLLMCLSRADGKVLWERKMDQGNEVRMKQNMSSPSPVTDGKHVWAATGNGVVVAYDMEGNEVWKFDIAKEYGPIGTHFGYGSSPLLMDGMVVLQVLHGMKTDAPSYVLALDGASGKVLWRVERATDALQESPDAYTTPTVLEHDGKKQIVVLGGNYVTGHDPATGAELWRSGGLNPKNSEWYRTVPSPTAIDGIIYAPTRQQPLLALRAGGSGDITASHLIWSWTEKGGPDVPSPAVDGKYFYMAEDGGRITCLDAKTGKVHYGPEDTGIGRVSASPLLADGKVYLVSEGGETAVLAAGPEFKLLGTNKLDDSFTLSSPIAEGDELFIRTGTHLYCIGN